MEWISDMSVSTFEVEDGNTKGAIIKNSKKSYLVMEAEKFLVDGVYKFASLYDFDGVILDEKPEEKLCSELEKNYIKIID